ncbi:YhdP family protein [Marinomonas vulgaris]|uniref:YhdP family protein n=1 Tax=Marinomonas vulgaris TaxID=2823372 RepID=UPI001F3FD7D8|nr:YhdP family protein [Marinomonas vulgaris]
MSKLILISFWGAVTFSAIIAIFALSVGQLLPYLDNYRPQIEQNLEQIIGYPISLNDIDGRLEGIDPTVSISGFQLNTKDQTAVNIDELRVRLDTVKSLINLSPQFTYIRFIRPSVNLQEREGQWQLSGATASRSKQNDVGMERVLDYLSAQQNFSILDANMAVDSDQFGEHTLNIPHIYLVKNTFESLLSADLYLDDATSPLTLSARINKTHSVLGDYRVKASIQTPDMALPVDTLLPSNNFSLASVRFGSDIWLDYRLGKELEIQTQNTALTLAFEDGQTYQLRSAAKLNYAQKHPAVRLDVSDLRIEDKEGVIYPPSDMVFDWSSLTGRSSVAFNRLDLALSNRIAAYFVPDETVAAKILTGLSPVGTAKNGVVRLWKEDEQVSFQFLSNLQSTSVNAYNGIPQVSNINAILSLSNDGGYVDFKGQGSQLYFDTVYDDAWRTDALSGFVGWQKQQDAFVVSGRDLIVQRKGADVSGGFRLEVRDSEPDLIALDLHGNNLSVDDRLTYIPPKALSTDLMTWIEEAFQGDGQIPTADVIVHGELSGGGQPHVRVKMAVSDADVMFDKNWPTATDVNGTFAYDAAGVSVAVSSGYLLELPVKNLALSVPVTEGEAPWLNLRGAMDENVNLLLTTLRKTPLAELVLQPFESWYVGGDVSGDFDVAIPFSEGQDAKVALNLAFQDNALSIKDIQLEGYVQSGAFHYDTERGVTDSEFDVQALGGVTQLALSSATTPEGGLAILGDLAGTVDIKKVAIWNNLPDVGVKKIQGQARYTGRLAINESQEGQIDLDIDSLLVGVAATLPEPVGKTAEEETPLRVKVMLHESDIVIDADYAAMSKARILLQDGAFAGGELVLGRKDGMTLRSSIPKGLVVTGSFQRFMVEDWQSAFTDLSDTKASVENQAPNFDLPEWVSQANVIVDEVVVNDYNTWHNVKLAYNRGEGGALRVSSDEMNVSITKQGGVPDVHFGFLSWNTEPEDVSVAETDASIAPITAQQIPNMSLSVDQFYLNESPYGDWQMTITRDGDRVKIEPIGSKLKTGQFKGHLYWLDRGVDSSVELAINANGADLAELTGKFSNDAFVSSKKYNIDVGLNWQGHPFHFARETVSGNIDFSAENGNFVKVDELPAFLKALGIFNMGALSRRLTLDFSDVYQPGLTYDSFKGTLSLNNGILKTVSPITIISPSAELVVSGEANIVTETLNEKLTATFPISGTLPLAGLLWGTPQLAGILFITDKLIGDQLSKVTSVQYKVEGSFNDPVMSPVRYQPLGKSK